MSALTAMGGAASILILILPKKVNKRNYGVIYHIQYFVKIPYMYQINRTAQ